MEEKPDSKQTWSDKLVDNLGCILLASITSFLIAETTHELLLGAATFSGFFTIFFIYYFIDVSNIF